MEWVKQFDQTQMPMYEDILEYIELACFKQFDEELSSRFKLKSKLEFSRCVLDAGWNIKYKKSGRNIVIVYPKKGFFRVLIALKEIEDTSFLENCHEKIQMIYHQTQPLNGSRWLVFDIDHSKYLQDLYTIIDIKVGLMKKRVLK